MALIYCNECGSKISDVAKVCPHCGYPIQQIRNTKIDQQNRRYFKELNKNRLLVNVFVFLIAFLAGIYLLKGKPELWAWGLYFANLAIVLFLCLSKLPYIFFFLVHFSQQYTHMTRFSYVVSLTFGFAIGGIVGMGYF